MLTQTAQKHLVSALVDALRIFPDQAEEILFRAENFAALDYLTGPLHDTKVLVCEGHGTKAPTAHLFRIAFAKGYEPIGILHLRESDLAGWIWAYQDQDRSLTREITKDLRRSETQRAPTADERWITAEIIGYERKDDHVEYDLQIDGQSRLDVAAAYGLHETEYFADRQNALINYTGALLGCYVDMLIRPASGGRHSSVDHIVVGIIPGGLKASQIEALVADSSASA